MPRYAIKVEYHGVPFAGWQRQTNQLTVQGKIEEALAKIQPGPHKIAAAGRTDAGVHALAQVAHCDMTKDWKPYRLSEALNYHLKPNPIAIVGCAKVPDDWHARFWAQQRQYMFRMSTRRAPETHQSGLVWRVPRIMDIQAIQEAADILIGTHDFTTFRSTICQAKSPVKTLDYLKVEEIDTEWGVEVRFHVHARSFLHNQVRSFVGTLERVGAGTWTPEDVRTALNARTRSACGPVSPPQGLYLSGVVYENDPFDPPYIEEEH